MKAEATVCWLCGEGLDHDLVWPDPGAIVIDHVIAFVDGGEDNISNYKCAHNICNLRKSKKSAESVGALNPSRDWKNEIG